MKDLNIGGKYSFSGFGYFSPAFTVTAQWAMSMAGLNFFDFHMMAFFPFFFLTAYTFYIYGKDWLSLIFFLIATLTKFPFDIFILIFALEELLLYIYLNRKNKTAKFKILSIPVILLVFSSGSLIAGELLSLIGPSNISNFAHFSNVAVFPFGQIILTFFIIFGVVLFIPLYSKRWVFFFVPYTILVILAQNQAYYFPGVFTDQYSVLYYPFIFLGLIDVIASRKLKEESITKSTKNNHKHKFNISNSMKTIVPIFIILLLMSAAFQPWSPAIKNNAYINYYHNDCNPQQAYQTYIYLSEESKLIPQTNPYVLVTNDIPEAYPRALINGPYRVGELVMGFPSPVFENISIQDAVNNTFPYITWNGTVINIPIDYAWAISTSAVFNAKSGTQSMSEIIQVMLASGKYGIIAQADGTILLMRNYMGSPILYTPINYNIQTNDVPDPALYTIINKLYNYSN